MYGAFQHPSGDETRVRPENPGPQHAQEDPGGQIEGWL